MPRLVSPIMGTTVSFDVRDPEVPDELLVIALDALRLLERRFSPFDLQSEVSRYGRGEIEGSDMSPELVEILSACERLRHESGGAFDPWGHRPDRRFDPSGFVKGWAADRAAFVLKAGGAKDFMINLGGDVICAGEPAPGLHWQVGIRHPTDPGAVALVLAVRDGAVATSGQYERPDHLRDARTGGLPGVWDSFSVVAPNLELADALATTGFALGLEGPAFVIAHGGLVAAIRNNRLWTSPELNRARTDPIAIERLAADHLATSAPIM